jgi:TolB-like protein/DNA-binding SARP family transcriptional activator
MRDAACVDLRLLGGFAAKLDRGARPEVRIRSRKGCALIAYLAMHSERRASRERLSDLLWGDRFDDRARQNLRQCLVGVRTDLANAGADLLVLEQDAVGLRSDRLTVDALDFATLADASDLLHQEQAISLYHGDFLAEFSLDVEGFDEWVRSERSRLAAMATRLFEIFAARADHLGMGEAAVSAAARLVAVDPLREDWQRLALRLCARYHGREAALARARAFTAQLKNELGVSSDAATNALIEEIKQGAIAPLSPVAVQILQPMSDRADTATEEAPDRAGGEHSPVTGGLPVETTAVQPRPIPAFIRRWSPWPLVGVAGVAVAMVLTVLARWWTAGDQMRGQLDPPPTNLVMPDRRLDGAGLAAKGLYSIAVLPFTASADDDRPGQAVADRITDDLINDLSRAGGLQVISRPTSDLYRGRPIDVAEIGAELGVRYVAVGNVRSEDTLVRINVELVDTSTRVQAWTGRIERARSELPAAIDEIAWGITRQLHVAITMAEDHRPPRNSKRDPEIGQLLSKGWSIIFRHNVTGTTAPAEDNFKQVLQRDSENLSATIGLAAHYVISVSNLYVPEREPYLSRADKLLAKAIDKEPHSSRAYYFLGILQKTRGQPEAALRSFTIALELSPSNAPASAQVGSVLAMLGRANEAMEYIHRAIRLSPNDPALGRWDMFGGQIEIELGHDEPAIEWLLRAVALNPRNARAHALLGAAYALNGNIADATSQVAEVKKLVPWAVDKIFDGFSAGRADGHVPRYVRGWQMAVTAASPSALHQP